MQIVYFVKYTVGYNLPFSRHKTIQYMCQKTENVIKKLEGQSIENVNNQLKCK